MIVVVGGRNLGRSEEIRREREAAQRALEEERDRMERILRGLQEKDPGKEREPEEDFDEPEYQPEEHGIVSCKRRTVGHLISWYTSGFQ